MGKSLVSSFLARTLPKRDSQDSVSEKPQTLSTMEFPSPYPSYKRVLLFLLGPCKWLNVMITDLKCNSLLILNNSIFTGEIIGILFVLEQQYVKYCYNCYFFCFSTQFWEFVWWVLSFIKVFNSINSFILLT